ncbi:phosphoribosylanthranilate isomerase [Enterococcus sp. DIV0876]|uniref:phosphoribosylanthranilate isomerase n=1 Tax=Enterococcus sp. DIV0876 TaxID=2774633 RepID=UPI003D2F9CC4
MTKVKICGLTQETHVAAAVAAGADYLGFVFANSRRFITADAAKKITTRVPAAIHKVGVFVQPTFIDIKHTCDIVGLSHIQLHGTITPSVQQALEKGAFQQLDVSVIQAFNGEALDLKEKLQSSLADFILLDAPADTTAYAGGNGQTFNWHIAAKEHTVSKPLFVAGGLNLTNVQQAITCFTPYAVDISSGVETNGTKDSAKITAFIQKVKELSINETTNE